MEFEKVIKERFSARKFKPDTLPDEVINKILEAGRLAPTAKNYQPQYIYVIKSEEGLAKLDKATRCRYNAPVCFLICGNMKEAFLKIQPRGNHSTYEMDACIVATHMMLEATNLGVDNIWVELFDEEILREAFDIPEHIIPVCLLNMGYKTDDCPVSPLHYASKDLKDMVTYR